MEFVSGQLIGNYAKERTKVSSADTPVAVYANILDIWMLCNWKAV